MFAGIPLSSLVSLINGVIVYFVLENVIATYDRRVWLIALGIVTLLRFFLYLFYQKTSLANKSIPAWHRLFTVGSFASGCVWGLLSLLLFTVDSVLHQAFIAFVIAGMTAAAVTTLSAYWLNAMLFILPALLPLIVRFFPDRLTDEQCDGLNGRALHLDPGQQYSPYLQKHSAKYYPASGSKPAR